MRQYYMRNYTVILKMLARLCFGGVAVFRQSVCQMLTEHCGINVQLLMYRLIKQADHCSLLHESRKEIGVGVCGVGFTYSKYW